MTTTTMTEMCSTTRPLHPRVSFSSFSLTTKMRMRRTMLAILVLLSINGFVTLPFIVASSSSSWPTLSSITSSRTIVPPSSTSSNIVPHSRRSLSNRHPWNLRGGGTTDPTTDNNNNDDNDEERYSRQFYTLGARAHSLVRSSVILLDGPLRSGLVYETVKNLALSGVGTIVLLTTPATIPKEGEEENDDGCYYNEGLDDLGCVYRNTARIECEPINDADEDDNDGGEMISEYIKRLNPSVKVRLMDRTQFVSLSSSSCSTSSSTSRTEDGTDETDQQQQQQSRMQLETLLGPNPVLLCIDRPQSTQIQLDSACRNFATSTTTYDDDATNSNDDGAKIRPQQQQRQQIQQLPFVSIETAGVYGRVFCDFGNQFQVVDTDGETPKTTLLDRVVVVVVTDEDGGDGIDDEEEEWVVHCVEGERHDVSKDDTIVFQFNNDNDTDDDINNDNDDGNYRCTVLYVKSPTCITVKIDTKNRRQKVRLLKKLNNDHPTTMGSGGGGGGGGTKSFTRIKLPTIIPFLPLDDALQTHRKYSRERRRRQQGKQTKTNGSMAVGVVSEDQLFAASDLDKSYDMVRRDAIMACFAALDGFMRTFHRLPFTTTTTTIVDDDESDNDNDNNDDYKTFSKLTSKQRPPKKDDQSSSSSKKSAKRQRQKYDTIIHQFATYAKTKFTPLQAFYGALGAQEALKAASGLYVPIRQFLLYDCDEILNGRNNNDKGVGDGDSDSGSGSSGLTYLLGHKTANKLASQRIFVVGAGAIGCEILKNLSAMGAGTGSTTTPGSGKKTKHKKRRDVAGRIVLTDMDTIEKSNLSRQLLFRDNDVGKFKSVAAKEALLRLNPSITVEVHTSKVGDDSTSTDFSNNHHFDDDQFWSSEIDIVLNALDNVEARLHIDSRCVAHHHPLVDAGTLGSKGNVQVVVPRHKSESYGSSVDPPEPAIPVCTLKNFPYEVSHTIQWAKDLFGGLFGRRVGQASGEIGIGDHGNDEQGTGDGGDLMRLSLEEYAELLIRKLGDDAALEVADELHQDILPLLAENENDANAYKVKIRQNSIKWAFKLATKLYYTTVIDLLLKHPVDDVDDDGDPFWSGTRRAPKALTYSGDIHDDDGDDGDGDGGSGLRERLRGKEQELINGYIIDFVRYAARLRIEAYFSSNSNIDGDGDSVVTADEAIKVILQLQNSDGVDSTNPPLSSQPSCSIKQHIIQKLQQPKQIITHLALHPTQTQLNPTSFEKDDETNGHVSFLTAASNLRALSYSIPPSTPSETRRIAGRIVPAMITTTALVSALSCLELVKLVMDADLGVHRNSFVNLALPFFAFTVPLKAEERVGLGDDEVYTIWDRVLVKERERDCVVVAGKKGGGGGISLKRIIRQIQKQMLSNSCSSTTTLEVASVSYGPYLLYANFLNVADDTVLCKPLLQLIKEAIISEEDDDLENFNDDEVTTSIESTTSIDHLNMINLTESQREEITKLDRRSYIELNVLVEDTETYEEVELPPVRVVRWCTDDDRKQ